MKNILMVVLFLNLSVNLFAQETEMEKADNDEGSEKGGFKKENLFTGGGIQLSFSGSSFVAGASPVLGYSINRWIDAGIVVNFTYYTNRHVTYYDNYTGQYFTSDDKLKQTIFGPGVFLKVYPAKFLFVQAQAEINYTTQKLIFSNGAPEEKNKYSAPSLLVGAGYSGGREGIGSFFYHISIMFDVLRDRNSPYVEEISNGKVNVLPIVRAGIQVPLFQGRRR